MSLTITLVIAAISFLAGRVLFRSHEINTDDRAARLYKALPRLESFPRVQPVIEAYIVAKTEQVLGGTNDCAREASIHSFMTASGNRHYSLTADQQEIADALLKRLIAEKQAREAEQKTRSLIRDEVSEKGRVKGNRIKFTEEK